MRNSFSQMFAMEEQAEKKFYFVPNKPLNAPLRYLVHINGDADVKKFAMEDVAGNWKIKAQEVKLPKWLFTLEDQFDQSIKEKVTSQTK